MLAIAQRDESLPVPGRQKLPTHGRSVCLDQSTTAAKRLSNSCRHFFRPHSSTTLSPHYRLEMSGLHPNLATVAAPPRGSGHVRPRGASSRHLPELFSYHFPRAWAYDHPWGLILHPTHECETCFNWFWHHEVHLYREEPSLVAVQSCVGRSRSFGRSWRRQR